jgi:hypothetical protein
MATRRKAALLAGAALGLMVIGTGSVFAQTASPAPTTAPTAPQTNPKDGNDQGWGWGGMFGGDQMNPGMMNPGRMGGRGNQMGPMGGRGGRGGDFGYGFGNYDQVRQLVREEITVDLGTSGGIVTRRLEHGTVTASSATSVTISLANGQSSTIALDGNTNIAKAPDYSTRTRGSSATAADVTVGSEVVVASKSQSDGSYLASGVWILPAASSSSGTTTTPAASPSPATQG